MNILITEPDFYSHESLEKLSRAGTVWSRNIQSDNELSASMQDTSCDLVFAKLGLRFDEALFASAPSLKIIATPTTGLTHIDSKACIEHDIKVISLRNKREFLKSITTTAEHIWFLLLSLTRQSSRVQSVISAGNWSRGGLEITQLSGKKIGIIGFGRLGEIVADYALAFRTSVTVFDIGEIDPDRIPEGVHVSETLDELLSVSDFVVLSASYNGEKILHKGNLPTIKHGASLINASRGELVDENVILSMLDEEHLAGYATDVLDGDSVWNGDEAISSPLFARARSDHRIYITPHIGGYALDAIRATRSYLVDLVLAELGIVY